MTLTTLPRSAAAADAYAVGLMRAALDTFRDAMHPVRPSWDGYGLILAHAAAFRADCTRRTVGAVILDRRHRVVAAGYNGAPTGGPSCLAGECPRGRSDVAPGTSYDTGPGTCVAVHAEVNALMHTSRDQLEGATLYITDEPCDGCWRIVAASGVARVVWPTGERVL